jgi:Nucleotidyl transferase AbiEii toxin, Type IV TA system
VSARDALLRAFLRRAIACPEAGGLVLRGSLLLNALCPNARPPQDVDYLVPGPFDREASERIALAIIATSDPAGGPPLALEDTAVIFGETPWPGLRAFVSGGGEAFQVDFSSDDPLPEPPRPVEIAGAGRTLACTAETLFGWKLHGLVEFGRGRWRAKDLFDLWLLYTRLPLALGPLRTAIELAFSSRDTPLSTLDDLRTRPAWGESRSGSRGWRTFARRTPAAVPEFAVARGAVREALDAIYGPVGPAPG